MVRRGRRPTEGRRRVAVIRVAVLGGALAFGLAACIGSSDGGSEDGGAATAELMALYAARDYFELSARLDSLPEEVGPGVTFLRAVTAHAFNDPAASDRHLADLGPGAEALPDSLRAEVYRMRFRNRVRLQEYDAAMDAARALASLPGADSATRADVANEARAVEALVGAPGLRIVARRSTELARRPDGRVPVQMGDSIRGYVFDTGANLSALMRSEADALGLEILPAGVEVGTSTGAKVTADVTVAPRVRLGDVELANVPFLVLPDAALTFTPEFSIPGIIGFPVMNALGEVEFLRGGVLRFPATAPDRPIRNLALDYLTPLVEVRILEDDAVCELDTGANRTSVHLPFYLRHREAIEAQGRADTIRTAGAGGQRQIPAYILADLRLGLADTAVVLPEVFVFTESVASSDEPGADCRLGLDALAGFDGYLINLRSMTFLTR